jgi:acyl-CoA reductase-like NAD-dependent aldehyde dehydrogenase
MDAPNWKHMTINLSFDGRPVIAGVRQDGQGASFLSVNPATQETVALISAVSQAQIESAITQALSAQASWRATSKQDRALILHSLAQKIEQNAQELALYDSLEMGMPISQALGDIALITGHLRYCAQATDKLADDTVIGKSSLAYNVREAHGVVAAITPWNFPLYNAVLKLAPALAMGNAVILKPSEIASLSSLRLGDLAREAGLPNGVLSVLTGGGEVGAILAAHPLIDHLAFTGSTATGKLIMQAAGASNLKSLALECGGKGAQLILPDVTDFEARAGAFAASAFWNTGQVCVAGSRLIAPKAHVDKITEAICAAATAWTPADPLLPETLFGPLSSRRHADSITATLAAALRDGGGRKCTGQDWSPDPTLKAGAYMPAIIVDRLHPSSLLAKVELFGPVLAILAYDTVDEAVSIVNSLDYGLSASVHTQDAILAIDIASQLKVGTVSVALSPNGLPVEAPSLGVEPRGQSGFGVEGGLSGLVGYTRLKLVSLSGG